MSGENRLIWQIRSGIEVDGEKRVWMFKSSVSSHWSVSLLWAFVWIVFGWVWTALWKLHMAKLQFGSNLFDSVLLWKDFFLTLKDGLGGCGIGLCVSRLRRKRMNIACSRLKSDWALAGKPKERPKWNDRPVRGMYLGRSQDPRSRKRKMASLNEWVLYVIGLSAKFPFVSQSEDCVKWFFTFLKQVVPSIRSFINDCPSFTGRTLKSPSRQKGKSFHSLDCTTMLFVEFCFWVTSGSFIHWRHVSWTHPEVVQCQPPLWVSEEFLFCFLNLQKHCNKKMIESITVLGVCKLWVSQELFVIDFWQQFVLLLCVRCGASIVVEPKSQLNLSVSFFSSFEW